MNICGSFGGAFDDLGDTFKISSGFFRTNSLIFERPKQLFKITLFMI